MTDEALPDFKGKIVILYVAGVPSARRGLMLEDVAPVHYGGRVFLIGRYVSARREHWAAGLQAGVAWDSVVHYSVFESFEDYRVRGRRALPWWRRLFS